MTDGKVMRVATWAITAHRSKLIQAMEVHDPLRSDTHVRSDSLYRSDDDVRRDFLAMVRNMSASELDALLGYLQQRG